jgi:hypothetical protein
MKYYVVFTNGMAMLYYKMLTRDRLALGEVVFVKLLSEPAKGICPSSDCDGSVIHSRMRMVDGRSGWSEISRMIGPMILKTSVKDLSYTLFQFLKGFPLPVPRPTLFGEHESSPTNKVSGGDRYHLDCRDPVA